MVGYEYHRDFNDLNNIQGVDNTFVEAPIPSYN